MTTPADNSQARIALAEAIVDASRSLDRTRRKVEALVEALSNMPNESADNITRCRIGIVQIQQLNNDIRGMAS